MSTACTNLLDSAGVAGVQPDLAAVVSIESSTAAERNEWARAFIQHISVLGLMCLHGVMANLRPAVLFDSPLLCSPWCTCPLALSSHACRLANITSLYTAVIVAEGYYPYALKALVS